MGLSLLSVCPATTAPVRLSTLNTLSIDESSFARLTMPSRGGGGKEVTVVVVVMGLPSGIVEQIYI